MISYTAQSTIVRSLSSDADVSLLAPASSPGVSDLEVSIGIAYSIDSMVDGVRASGIKDSTLITHERTGVY
jgi:hypothetical protein